MCPYSEGPQGSLEPSTWLVRDTRVLRAPFGVRSCGLTLLPLSPGGTEPEVAHCCPGPGARRLGRAWLAPCRAARCTVPWRRRRDPNRPRHRPAGSVRYPVTEGKSGTSPYPHTRRMRITLLHDAMRFHVSRKFIILCVACTLLELVSFVFDRACTHPPMGAARTAVTKAAAASTAARSIV